jgi:hypothetical protein
MWTALTQRWPVTGMQCVVSKNTQEWTMACPWAVGSSSSRGCSRRPPGLWRSRESLDKTCSLLVSRGWAQVGRDRHTALPKLWLRYFPHSLCVCWFIFLYKMWGFHSGGYEEYHLLGYDTLYVSLICIYVDFCIIFFFVFFWIHLFPLLLFHFFILYAFALSFVLHFVSSLSF